jgi:uncharacterized protein (DUF433 family)
MMIQEDPLDPTVACYYNYSEMREDLAGPSEPVFTVLEVSALLDLPERKVRKEFELGVLPESSPPRVSFEALVWFLAVSMFDLNLRLTTSGKKNLFASIRKSLAHWGADREPDDIVFGNKGGGYVIVQVKYFARDARTRVESFREWKERRVVWDPKILGGEPVFRDSRLSVRHIGGLPASEKAGILEDYPYLNEDDLHFAGVFARAYPRLGRPRESSEAPR